MSESIIYLSHTINNKTPIYGNKGNPIIRKTSQMEKGDTSNNSELILSAHTGTHIDAPYHFYEEGKTIEQYAPEFWICYHPCVMDINVELEEIITLNKIKEQLDHLPPNTDLLIIRTGFAKYRKNNVKMYTLHNPGIAPEVGEWLRKYHRIKMIGFDFISLSSYVHRDLGRMAHKAFLGKMEFNGQPMEPILIIEDMDLSKLNKSLKKVIVSPLRFQFSDGSPVTVTGWIN